TFVVDHEDDEMIFDQIGHYPAPKVTGSESFDVRAGTLTFDDCRLPVDNATTWILSDTGTIHVKPDCFCGTQEQPYTGCAIDISGDRDEVLFWVERGGVLQLAFKTTGRFDMSGGTLETDGNFVVAGRAQLSGGRIKVAPGKWAEFRFAQ
ncbi:unnamed protein product, partial [marine sediment metagenome]